MLARARKAAVAGLGAGIAAAAAVIMKADVLDSTTRQQAIGAFIAAAATIGWTTWRVPNAPAVSR